VGVTEGCEVEAGAAEEAVQEGGPGCVGTLLYFRAAPHAADPLLAKRRIRVGWYR